MKKCTFILAIVFGTTIVAFSQTTTCPQNFVCISTEAARKALQDSDTVKAQEQQILDLKKAILDEKSVTIDVKIELAKTTGQLTGAQSELISLRAMNELLLKMVRPKKIGLINLF